MNATWTKLWLTALAAAAVSLLGPSQPGYDPWAWLIWGREVAALEFDTVDGPAWKPLPVAITTALSAAGPAAPELWLVVARTGAIAAVLLAGRLAWRLGGGSWLGALAAAAGVALSAGWAWHGAVGNSEGLFLALALTAFDQALDGRDGRALTLAFGAALLRPESWPLLGLYGAWLWWRRPGLRPALAGAAVALPALWFLPEQLGSGDLLRSSERARIPNPGAPATAGHPALASLRGAVAIPLAPVAALGLAAAVASVRSRVVALRAALPAAAGVAWVGIVALMAEGGYSGEPRYALPGAAVLAVSGGVGLAAVRRRAGRGAGIACLAVIAAFGAVRLDGVAGELARAADDARLFGSLDDAVARAGGAGAMLACGRPVTGHYRGTAVAWALGVPKRVVAFDPALGGAILRSRVRSGASVQPPAPPGAVVVARSARWEVRAPAACARATR
jgi:hypothetical protein